MKGKRRNRVGIFLMIFLFVMNMIPFTSFAGEQDADDRIAVLESGGKEISIKEASPIVGENAGVKRTPMRMPAMRSQPESKEFTIGRYSENGLTYTELSGSPSDYHSGHASGYFYCVETGNPGFCMNSTCLSPLDGLNPKSGTAYSVTDETLRKFAYYGLDGPGYSEAKAGIFDSIFETMYRPHLGDTTHGTVVGSGLTLPLISDVYTTMANSLTHESISRYNPYDDKAGDGHGYYRPVGMDEFVAWIDSAANPPENFHVWRWAGASGKQDILTWEINPTGKVNLTKSVASNKHLTDLCPENYSLEGAIYGVYLGDTEMGRLTTDAEGKTNTLELDPGTYTVKEITAPKGYKLDTASHTATVTSGETATVEAADVPLFDPLSLKIQKKAAEGSDKNLPLEGAEYTVKYYKELTNDVSGLTPFRTWVFRTNENGEIFIKPGYKISGDELFKKENGVIVGLFGTYTFEETKAPKGFAKTDGLLSIQQITQGSSSDQVVVLKDVTDVEKPQTVSIRIQKIDAESGKAEAQGYGSLEGAIFDVIYFDPLTANDVTVGRITTDAEGKAELTGLRPGKYTVHEVQAPKGYLRNTEDIPILARIKEENTANFEYVAEVPEKPTTVLVEKTGLGKHGVKESPVGAELSLMKDGNVIESWVTDGSEKVFKGLAPGKYEIHETKAPDGYLLPLSDYEFEVKEIEEEQRQELFNEPIPEIKTYAFFEGDVKHTLPKEKVTLFDEVSYDRLIPGETYTVEGSLVDYDDPGHVISKGELTFTPETSEGKVTVTFSFDGKALEGKTLVVTEDLYKADRLLVSHADIDDENQQVTVPKIGTKATDKSDDGKDLLGGPEKTIKDTVSYYALIPGEIYTAEGVLMVKGTKKPLLSRGKEVRAEKTFTPDKADGEVELLFTFDAEALQGETIVVFEKITHKGIEVATHTEIEDEGQSVHVPKIKTTAHIDGEKKVEPKKDITITDIVQYENLLVGETYIVKGIIMDEKTGKPFLSGGNEVRAEKTFTPEKADGEVELFFTFDGEDLTYSNLVVFEKIYREDKLIGIHEDMEDKGQTVTIEKIGKILLTDKPHFAAYTGDRTHLALYMGLGITSFSVCLYLLYRSLKKKNS